MDEDHRVFFSPFGSTYEFCRFIEIVELGGLVTLESGHHDLRFVAENQR